MLPGIGNVKPGVPGFSGYPVKLLPCCHHECMPGGKTVVELRVHGVSGTPPEAMLNCPTEFLNQISGDEDAAFYRRAQWIDDAASPPKEGRWRRLMEVYSWGGLTSRRASRAVWLLFLPFTLANLAHWMLPPAQRKMPATLAVAVLRLIALSFTLTLLLAMAVAVLDVTVWQCVAIDYCSAGGGPLAFLAAESRGAQLAYGALPLLAVIVVLWWLGREEVDTAHDTRTPPEAAVMAGTGTPLAADTFWIRDDSVLRLRMCHVTAWSSGLAAIVLAVPVRYPMTDGVRAVSIGLLVANLLILALMIAVTAWNRATARGGPGADRLLAALQAVRVFALVLLAVSLIWVARADVAYPKPPTHLPGLRGAIYGLLAVQVVLLVALFVCTALSQRAPCDAAVKSTRAGYEMSVRGFAGPFVVVLGWLLGGGFSVGIGLAAPQLLGKVVVSTAGAAKIMFERRAQLVSVTEAFDVKVRGSVADAPLIVPPPYLWAAVGTVAMIAVAIVAGVYLWLRVVPRRTTEFLGPAEGDYPGGYGVAEHSVNRRIARGRALASLTDVGVRLVALLATVAAAMIAAVALYYLSEHDRFDRVLIWSSRVTNASVVVTVAVSVGVGALVIMAYRKPQLRKVVGILWDVATFWPRANHPLTPPSYGKRTVWDLRIRLAALDTADSRVVLVAHSQGTIIAAATLLQAKGFEGKDEQYPLLTFGSPLRRLYAQNFPAYFGAEALDALRDRQSAPRHRWINLWVCSDPIGSWVFGTAEYFVQKGSEPPEMTAVLPSVDTRIPDVAQQDSMHGKYYADPLGPVCGHSGFWQRGEYDKAVDALQATVAPEGVDTAASVQPTRDAV